MTTQLSLQKANNRINKGKTKKLNNFTQLHSSDFLTFCLFPFVFLYSLSLKKFLSVLYFMFFFNSSHSRYKQFTHHGYYVTIFCIFPSTYYYRSVLFLQMISYCSLASFSFRLIHYLQRFLQDRFDVNEISQLLLVQERLFLFHV